jgi:glycosyltransferase involved in cell wall biosynthesis
MEQDNKYTYTPLAEPIPITEQEWPEGTLPLVHTRTMTYMHESYIRDCIEGILMQKTTFPVQVLIHDDASTDKTAEIVREYEQKYPCLIKSYYQKENSYYKTDRHERRIEFTNWRIGKYEAICEGDDYWTDPLKLQKQVDFMEANSDVSLVFTNRWIEKGSKFIPSVYLKKTYSTKDILSGFNFGIQSILFRHEHITNCYDYIEKVSKINADRLIPYLCSQKGKIVRLKDYTCVYRITGKGIATGRSKDKVFEMSMNDFLTFHQVLNFPNKKALIKGQAIYISVHFFKEIKYPFVFLKTTCNIVSKYFEPTMVDYLYYAYYSCMHLISIAFYRIYRYIWIIQSNDCK